MIETIGTLDLKIARLERQIADLKQREQLSGPYPTHRALLNNQYLRAQMTLHQLAQYRRELIKRWPTA